MSFSVINKKILAKRLKMNLEISGTFDKRQEIIFGEAVYYYLNKMIPKAILRNISLDLKVRTKVENNNEGYCDVEGWNTQNKPREFTIVVKKTPSMRYMLMTLAHECVHLKQYALGELNDNHTRWRGTRINDEKINYWELPWEIEAYGRERGLYTMFCEEYHYKFPKIGEQRDE